MRVLHVISSSGFYGAERTIYNLFAHDGGCEFSLAVFAAPDSEDAAFEEAVAKTGARVIRFRGGWRNSLGAVREMLRYVGNNPPDVIHAHGHKGLAAGLAAAFVYRLPLVYMQHGFIKTSGKLRCYTLFDKLLCRMAPLFRVLCVSDGIREEYARSGVPETKLVTLRNAVPLPLAPADRAGETGEPGMTTFIAVCRLSREKAPDVLLRAFAVVLKEHPACQLWLVGDGPRREALQELAGSLRIERNVVFWGFCRDPREKLATADIFVLPSLTEGTPMALLEAMTEALPVVCTAVGEIPRIVTAESGILVTPGSVPELAEGMKRMANAPAHERDAMGIAGRKIIEDSFSMDEYVLKLKALYGQAAREGAVRRCCGQHRRYGS